MEIYSLNYMRKAGPDGEVEFFPHALVRVGWAIPRGATLF